MPYTAILKRLLKKVEGALGVGFVAQDGEAVQLEGQFDDYAHRLHLAYQGILLQTLNRIHQKPGKAVSAIISVHQKYTVLVRPLKSGYLLVLTLGHRKNLRMALQQLDRAAGELDQEL
jgi:predicted regulator of Ras-like GTPase activity (Roadblock/LC7/MglB family)